MNSRLKKVYDITCKGIPSIAVEGLWLANFGFTIGSGFKIDYEPNHICLSIITESEFDFISENEQRDNISNIKLVRKIGKNKRGFPHIMLQGHFLEYFGFKIGTITLLQAKHGNITIRVLNG